MPTYKFLYSSIIFLLFLPLFVLAQQPYMRQITDEEGLPSLTVYDLYQDQNDYLWVATDKGLCRYDGHQFKYYSSPQTTQDPLFHIYSDDTGEIWCSNSQQELYQLLGDSLRLFQPVKKMLQGQKVLQYAFDQKSTLWILSENHLYQYRLDLDSWTEPQLDIQPPYRSISIDAKDQLWINNLQQLLKVGPKEEMKFELNNLELQTAYSLSFGDRVYLLQQQLQGQAAKVFQLKDDTFELIIPQLELQPKGLLQDREGDLWIYGFGGLYWQENDNPQAKKIIDEIAVSKVIQDQEGNHWISTLGAGIYFMPQPEIRYFARNNSSLDLVKVSQLALNSFNEIILGTEGQKHLIFSTKEDESTAYYESPMLTSLDAMHWDHSTNTLFTYQQALYQFNQVGVATASLLTNSNVHEIQTYDKEHLLLASDLGPLVVRKDFKLLQDSLLSKWPQAKLVLEGKGLLLYPKTNCQAVFVEQAGRIWVASSDSLFLCQQNSCIPILDQKGNPIRAIDITQTEDGYVWVASVSQGLLGLQEGAVQFTFDRRQGLKSTKINSLAVDGNSLWLATDMGILHLNSNRQNFSTYDKQDGLVSNEINDLLILDDEVWAASPKGLINFKQNLSSINAYPPPIYLRNFMVNGKKQALSEQYQLHYNENNISIEFQGIAYRAMQNFRYKYRLKGFSDVWYYIDGKASTLRFTALPSGHYLFEIRALNEDGVLSTEALKLNFVIQPPFWQRWWFIAIIVAAITILISSLLWWRLLIRQRFLGRINILKMQALQAQMNPHFVFNALNAIQTLMLTDDLELAMGYLNKFAKLIRSIFNISGLPAIELQEEINFLQLYMDLEKLRFGENISIDFRIDPKLEQEDFHIPPLLIQPIIENSFKHGLLHKKTKGQLNIYLQKDAGLLYVLIEDNGVGRDKVKELNQWKTEDTQKQSSGLSITTSRLQLLKHERHKTDNPKITDLRDEEGNALGTRVELWIPFQQASNPNSN